MIEHFFTAPFYLCGPPGFLTNERISCIIVRKDEALFFFIPVISPMKNSFFIFNICFLCGKIIELTIKSVRLLCIHMGRFYGTYLCHRKL